MQRERVIAPISAVHFALHSALCEAVGMNTDTQGTEARMVVPKDLIDAQTVAELLAVDKSTVTRRAKAGTLPVLAQLPSGFYIFDVNDIRAALAGAA